VPLTPETTLHVVQHTDAESLGLVEDHLEGRSIGFRYLRPHAGAAWAIAAAVPADGLVLLGAGPWGTVSAPVLPWLQPETELARAYLGMGRPVVGFGAGAQILAIAAGGGAEPAPFRLEVTRAHRTSGEALGGHLPETFPFVFYGRDRALPPGDSEILARDRQGRPAVFRIAGNSLGFAGHPGVKTAMIEDYVMTSSEVPQAVEGGLELMRAVQSEAADALAAIMVGVIEATGLMRARGAAP
jgi:GMP synthase-like glutamine amidotransferase